MTEDYLQYLWKLKRLPYTEFKLQDGEDCTIVNFGQHNPDLKGPDFFMGAIELDGIQLFGNIEIHVRSSDWYRHDHHNDRSYDNVILHVVYHHDQEVIQNGRKLPVLELKSLIDQEHFAKYQKNIFVKDAVPCKVHLPWIDSIYMFSMLEKALITKIQKKIALVQELAPWKDDQEAYYYFMSSAFGGNLNASSFLEVSKKVSFNHLRLLKASQRTNLLLTESGLITSQNSSVRQWHFKGSRPSSFPTRRLRQFAHLFDRIELLQGIEAKDVDQFLREWHNNISEHNRVVMFKHDRISASFADRLLINGVVPWLVYVAKGETSVLDFVFDLLQKLPAEQNKVVRIWKDCGITPKNAFESQGLLELFRSYCCRKKCLSCEIGNKVLNRNR